MASIPGFERIEAIVRPSFPNNTRDNEHPLRHEFRNVSDGYQLPASLGSDSGPSASAVSSPSRWLSGLTADRVLGCAQTALEGPVHDLS
jgi:hypothetical protein